MKEPQKILKVLKGISYQSMGYGWAKGASGKVGGLSDEDKKVIEKMIEELLPALNTCYKEKFLEMLPKKNEIRDVIMKWDAPNAMACEGLEEEQIEYLVRAFYTLVRKQAIEEGKHE